jgi:hypothetical protein
MARTSFALVTLATAGGMALLLGVFGIYGVIAYAVSQRRREIGIRLALGAQPRAIQALFVRRGVVLTGIGAAIGVCGAVVFSRVMESLVFGISPLDPMTSPRCPSCSRQLPCWAVICRRAERLPLTRSRLCGRNRSADACPRKPTVSPRHPNVSSYDATTRVLRPPLRSGGIHDTGGGVPGHRGASMVDDGAWRVEGTVGTAQGRDYPIAAALYRTEIDEQDLVLTMIDDPPEEMAAVCQIGPGELALEHRVLQMVPEPRIVL